MDESIEDEVLRSAVYRWHIAVRSRTTCNML